MPLLNCFLALTGLILAVGLFPKISRSDKLDFQDYLLNIFGLLVASVFIISLVYTKGKSVSVMLAPLIIYIFLLLRKPKIKWIFFSRQSLVYTFWLLAFSVFFFVIIAWPHYSYFMKYEAPGNIHFADYLYYAKLSQHLMVSGHEVGIPSDFSQPMPYHYFELWLNGILYSVTGLHPYSLLLFVIYPFLIGLTASLLFTMLKNQKLIVRIFSAILIFYFQFQYFNFLYRGIPFLSEDVLLFTQHLMEGYKWITIYLGFAVFFILFQRMPLVRVLPFISLLPFLYGPVIFGVVGMLGAGCILIIWNKWAKIPVFYLAASVILYFIFYSVTDNTGTANYIDYTEIKIRINIAGSAVLWMLILNLPFLIYVFLNRKLFLPLEKQNTAYIILLFSGVAFSLFAWIVFYNFHDSVQFFLSFSLPLILLGSAIILYRINPYVFITYTIVAMLFLRPGFYPDITLSENIKEKKYFYTEYDKGAFIRDRESYQYAFYVNPYFWTPFTEFYLFNPQFTEYDISLADIGKNEISKNAWLTRYYTINELTNYCSSENITEDACRKSFILKNNIRLVAVEKSAELPGYLIQLEFVKTGSISYSGEFDLYTRP